MKKKKSLQKFTDKVEWLFSLNKVTFNELDTLNKEERGAVFNLMNEKIMNLQGEERDKFIDQFSAVWCQTTKNQLWENNHILITGAISNLLVEYNRMPSVTEISEQTKLSRQTVNKHLREYKTNPLFLELMEQYQVLIPSLMSRVYKLACKGDVGAAKLYFNVMGYLNNGNNSNRTQIKNQNNYIQINGTILSQETLTHLNPEQLLTIETILKTAIPQQDNSGTKQLEFRNK